MPLQATSGAASYDAFGGGVPVAVNYIEDVFSTYLYAGNSTNRSIVNDIDLSGKGGLVWIKDRNAGLNHTLFDTARGATNYLLSDSTNAQDTAGNTLTAFNSNGFNLGTNSSYANGSGYNYASWTFRKQPKFFDVVTYTGNGTSQNIAHNLGSVPGCIIVKQTSNPSNWMVYHASLANTEALFLNLTNAKATGSSAWNSTTPTSTVFSVGANSNVNASGESYVAYIYAHNAGGFGLTGTDNVISCGSYTTDGSNKATVNLGYEPQWLLIKRTDSAGAWYLMDTTRSWSMTAGSSLNPNSSSAEADGFPASYIIPTATGFQDLGAYGANVPFIYIAIRRGPMKVPTSGTSVFSPEAFTGNATTRTIGNITTDSLFLRERASDSWNLSSRLIGSDNYLETNSTAAEGTATAGTRPSFTKAQLGVVYNGATKNQSSTDYIDYLFKRAPSFFDVVCYTGTGANRTVTHNLGVVPEMIIVKSRSSAQQWSVYTSGVGPTGRMPLQLGNAADYSDFYWNDTAPTASVFTVGVSGTTNLNGATMVAYLFATCAGVSKVGSYTGNGSSQTINCGFTSGSRLVLIKRTDSTGNWTIFDSARGIVSGNDPALYLNSTSAEVTSADAVDTDSTGFVVNQEGTLNLNVSSATYIFLSVA